MSRDTVTIDKNTGEVLEGRFISNNQMEAIQNTKEKNKLKNKSNKVFTFVEMNEIERGLNKLSMKDLGYLLVMETYIDYKNMLKLTPEHKLPMTREELAKALKVSPRTIVALIQRFKKNGLITESYTELYGKKYKGIFLSDEYCFRKSKDNQARKTDNAVKLFMSDLQDVYSYTNISATDIGFIYKIIPYLHYKTNYIVHNPDETDPAKAQYVSVNDLAEKFGISRQRASDRLSRLVYGNKYVFSRTKIGSKREVRLKANPFIIYRQAGHPKELAFEFYVTPPNK